MPEPTTVDVSTLFQGITLPVPCDPLTKLIPSFECIGGQWQLVLMDSEQFIAYLGIDVSTGIMQQKLQQKIKPCQGCGKDEQPATSLE